MLWLVETEDPKETGGISRNINWGLQCQCWILVYCLYNDDHNVCGFKPLSAQAFVLPIFLTAPLVDGSTHQLPGEFLDYIGDDAGQKFAVFFPGDVGFEKLRGPPSWCCPMVFTSKMKQCTGKWFKSSVVLVGHGFWSQPGPDLMEKHNTASMINQYNTSQYHARTVHAEF